MCSSDPSSSRPQSLPLDQRTYGRALDCVHCGLCLPACPTYTENGLEADSPRGRIYLMKAMADGRIDTSNGVLRHLDLCLDCRACETACPSGVIYHELIEETRHHLAEKRKPRGVGRLIHLMVLHVFPYPFRMKVCLFPVRLLQLTGLWRLMTKWTAPLLPAELEKMQQMLPAKGQIWPRKLKRHYPPRGSKRMTVGFFTGCVGEAMFQQTNQRAVELLAFLGCEVRVPRSQQCCGAIAHHNDRADLAAAQARRNIEAFEGCDAIVTDIAGCGAMLKEYDYLFRDDPQMSRRAKDFVSRVRDISELLVEFDLPEPAHAVNQRVTYHDACHLAHAQGITAPPRELLMKIKGLELVELVESEICCGAAGTYNLTEPAMARDLAERKLKHIRNTGCDTCVTGNVGCAMQIDSEARRIGMPLTVVHPIDLLHEAYLGR
jgi:glycolate oxidase iron-sulfur subunit